MTRDIDLVIQGGSASSARLFAAFWIVSEEDLLISKLVWAKDSGSELQRRTRR
jgi:hypothetical protein